MTRNKEILQIAIPSIISNITVPLLGIVDAAITGHMGSASFVAAIAVGGMLFNVTYWLFGFLRMGTSGMTAQALGRRDLTNVVGILQRAAVVAIAFSALLLLLQVPILKVAMALICPSEEVAMLTETYYRICIWGAPASLLLFALSGWFLGMQNSRAPMAIAIIQNVCNILLSITMVYVFGMKIEGVAIGTVLSQYMGLAVGIFILTRYRRMWRYRPHRLGEMKEFFSVNRDIFLRTLCLILVHFYFISAGAEYGDTALAVNTLIMQLFLLYSYIMDGFAFAGEALVGKAIGAGNHRSLHQIVRNLFEWGTALMILFTICYSLFDHQIMSLLTNEKSILTAVAEYHRWTLLLPLCGMAAFIWDGIYIGATATKGMLISMASGMAVFFLTNILLTPSLGNHALWLAFNTYILVRGLTQTILYRKMSLQKK